MKSQFDISIADPSNDLDALKRVREAVFVAEQGVPPELEWDEIDAQCLHLVARAQGGEVIGTARLCPGGHIGRMAVLSNWRGKGVGDALLRFLLDHARRADIPHLHLNAQTKAVGFYQRHGFRPLGEEFLDAGIPHLRMEMDAVADCALGKDSQESLLTDPAEVAASVLACIRQARRGVDILWPQLDVNLFGQPDTLDAVRGFVTENRMRQLRILVTDSAYLIDNGHPLLELARRMPSRMAIRVVSEHYANEADAYLVADETGYLRLLAGHEFRVRRCCDGRAESRRLAGHFQERWNHAHEDPRLRRLPL